MNLATTFSTIQTTDTVLMSRLVIRLTVFGLAPLIRLEKKLLVNKLVISLIIGTDANTIMQMKSQGDEGGIIELFKEAANKEFMIGIMAKKDNYLGNSKMRYQITRINKIKFREDGYEILKLLDQYAAKQ